jgi:hypothetical protein
MITSKRKELRGLEGRTVNLALVDGSRFDDVALVSARNRTVWIYTNGVDAFLPVDDVVDVWETCPVRPAA